MGFSYCKYCLNPESNPGITWEDGVCSACLMQKKEIVRKSNKPNQRKVKLLRQLLANKTVAIGVSGGKDSTRQAIFLREVIGIDPILICLSAPPEQNTELGARNLANLVELNFHLVTIHPDPRTWKRLALEAFRLFGNYGVSTELALYSAPIVFCLESGIDALLIGENPNFRDTKTFDDSVPKWEYRKLFSQNTLRNGNIDWIKDLISLGEVEEASAALFTPPDLEYYSESFSVIDLSWFIPNWSNLHNAFFSACHGISYNNTRESMNNGDLEGVSALDDCFVSVNQMIKYYKYGFGKVTDYVNENIRLGVISRAEGVRIVNEFDGKCEDSKILDFQKFLGISKNEFWETVNSFTNKNLFEIDEFNEIRPQKKFEVGYK